MLSLRKYQSRLQWEIQTCWDRYRRVLVILPPGGGKTAILAGVAQEFYRKQGKIWVINNRLNLIRQLHENITFLTGVKVRPIHHNNPAKEAGIYLGTIQYIGKHYKSWTKPDLIIVDEAHHCMAKAYREIFSYFETIKILGLTGTPCCSENRQLINSVFEKVLLGPTMKELIAQGFLCNYQIITINEPIYYNLSELTQVEIPMNKALEKELEKVLRSYRNYLHGESCIIFAPTVASCKIIHDFMQKYHISCANIEVEGNNEAGYTKVIKRFKEGEIKVLISCDSLIQGIDLPMVKGVIILRETQSLRLWVQMCGRVLRPWHGKGLALIIDHTNNYAWHGLPCEDRNWIWEPNRSLQKASQKQRELIQITERSLKTLSDILDNLDTDEQFTDNYRIVKLEESVNTKLPDVHTDQSEVIQNRKFLRKLEDTVKKGKGVIKGDVGSGYTELEKWPVISEDLVERLPIYKLYKESGIKKVIEVLGEDNSKYDWQELWSFFRYIREKREYHKKWLVHTFYKLRAPLEVWQQLALYLEYQPGWAYHCWRECQESNG